ncbi:hypothetical protein L7F22_059107 [Adiantum nelumboides]|nr:hypothetical protein [Adiantum nelumboides]
MMSQENDNLINYFELMPGPPALLYVMPMEEIELPRFYPALYPPHIEPADQMKYMQIVEQIRKSWEKSEGLWKEWIAVVNVVEEKKTIKEFRVADEDSDDYGPVIAPASAVAEAIKLRTKEHLKKERTVVSLKPIVMRIEYAYCPNLTIIDTPGFVLKKGEPENTLEDIIMSMVRTLAEPQPRLLLFLQQSSVKWCSSLWLDFIRSVNPSLRRTIIVISKFDNRLKEFGERWEVDRYLSAGGYLGETAHPFFVALPKDRSMTSNEDFCRQIGAVDCDVRLYLIDNIKGGFDEEKFGDYVGF